ncbi:hypothetical protein AVDCRST_MAG92-3827 [uncultured Coleofasciculus sp.]|uniref:Uncharacterized protein n=1 Tax=uncultured Coleofasciculus sp. TaxID=1267456 RepID=A0A6J4JR99_9CYAN|nr:hypothetical protein AVDCRST_MAG92-3827 [uncultured Coleofasciculus sp.]
MCLLGIYRLGVKDSGKTRLIYFKNCGCIVGLLSEVWLANRWIWGRLRS